MWNRSYMRYLITGVVLFAAGFAIGSTQSGEGGLLNMVAAIVGTVGAAMTVIAAILEVTRRAKTRSSQ